jgi:hypothetical protein
MKTFLGGKSKALDRKAALALAGINLLATPGLGTIMAGRVISGVLELAAAGVGFLLLMKWCYALFQTMVDGSGSAPSWEWQAGLLLFLVGWLASLWSSINFVKAASAHPVATPPKLDGSAG